MIEFTNEELLGLVDLLNLAADRLARHDAPMVLVHVNTDTQVPLLPILKKLLDECVERGILKRPPCFVPREN